MKELPQLQTLEFDMAKIEMQLDKSIAYTNKFQFQPLKFSNRVKLKILNFLWMARYQSLLFSFIKALTSTSHSPQKAQSTCNLVFTSKKRLIKAIIPPQFP